MYVLTIDQQREVSGGAGPLIVVAARALGGIASFLAGWWAGRQLDQMVNDVDGRQQMDQMWIEYGGMKCEVVGMTTNDDGSKNFVLSKCTENP
jgi:hypothetical protein